MITLQLTEDQQTELFEHFCSNPDSKVRNKCFIVYLRSMGFSRQTIANMMKIDEDTVTNHVKLYATGDYLY